MRHEPETRPTCALYASAFLTPFERAREAPPWAELLALAAALGQFLTGHPFVFAVVVLIGLHMADYMVGAAAAIRRGVWSADHARAGAIGKGAAILLTLVIRGVEGFLAASGLVDTRGAIAIAFVVLQIVPELRSFDRNQEAVSGRPTPGLRQVLDFLEGIAGGVLSSRSKPRPEVER